MSIGIQKLNGNSGPADVPFPAYLTSGMEKPANMIGRVELPAWPDSNGSMVFGPGIGGFSTIQIGSGNHKFTGKWGGIRISMWIRTSQNRGGEILSFSRAVTGTDSGPQAQGTDSFGISVGADGISAGGAECLFDLNEFNSGWHHVYFAYRTGGDLHELHVDGRPKTWTTPSSGSAFTSGFDALHIGGRMLNFLQGVTDYTINFEWSGGTQQFDIAQLAVYEGGGVGDFYPFKDLGTTGKAPGTFVLPDPNSFGIAHPYPIVYMNFDQSDFNLVKGWGFATTSTTAGEQAIENLSNSLTWYDITGKTSGQIGNGPISSGERLPPVNPVPYGSPASFTYNANRDSYYVVPLGGSINFWAYDDLAQDWTVSSTVVIGAGYGPRTLLFQRDQSAGKILFQERNDGGPGFAGSAYDFEFTYTPSAGWNHYSFLFSSQSTDTRTKTIELYVNGVTVNTSSEFDTYGNFTQFTLGANVVFNGVSFQQLYYKRSGRIDTRGRYVEFGGTPIADADSTVAAATADLYERFTPTMTNLVEPNATVS
jgi:hypothetical protein